MNKQEFRALIRDEIKKNLNEAIDINDKSQIGKLLIEAFMTGAYQSINVLGEYDEAELKKMAKEHAAFRIKQMK